MSMVHERIKIGVEGNGTVKEIATLTLDTLDYTLVSEGGKTFQTKEGLGIVERLMEAEPDKKFIVIAA